MLYKPRSIVFRRMLVAAILALAAAVFPGNDVYSQSDERVVRIARITIDSLQLESYRSALKEGIEAAVRIEPGVLTLFAVYDKADPTIVTVLEVYKNAGAYQSHLQTPHFRKYKATTQTMVKSLELIDVVPLAFATKQE